MLQRSSQSSCCFSMLSHRQL